MHAMLNYRRLNATLVAIREELESALHEVAEPSPAEAKKLGLLQLGPGHYKLAANPNVRIMATGDGKHWRVTGPTEPGGKAVALGQTLGIQKAVALAKKKAALTEVPWCAHC